MVMLVAMGAEHCSLSALGRRGSGEGFRDWNSNRRVGELPLFPLLIKREGTDVTHCQNKEYPHVLSHDAAFDACRWGRERWIRSKIRRNPGRACPCPVLGLAQ